MQICVSTGITTSSRNGAVLRESNIFDIIFARLAQPRAYTIFIGAIKAYTAASSSGGLISRRTDTRNEGTRELSIIALVRNNIREGENGQI